MCVSVFRLRAKVSASNAVGLSILDSLVFKIFTRSRRVLDGHTDEGSPHLVAFTIVGSRSFVVAITRFRWRSESLQSVAIHSASLQYVSLATPP